ncbi:STAS domain-containing protein [Pelagibacterium nitratireducens]|uniref:STAS domain-containing protein n=1 Tax=Pelagibacterium nitratireducens TaxID=1046114 RepID=A0ABZ2HYN9_9HYPH
MVVLRWSGATVGKNGLRLLLPAIATAGETECHPDPYAYRVPPMPDKDCYTLVLGADAGIKSAQNVATSLAQALSEHDHIALDTQTLSEADITTVQTLLAARAKAEQTGKTLEMLAPIGAPLSAVLVSAGFLGSGQEHAGFWTGVTKQQAGH